LSSGPWIRWNIIEVEAIIDAVSSTNLTLKQIMAARGLGPREYESFRKMLGRKSVFGEAYVQAVCYLHLSARPISSRRLGSAQGRTQSDRPRRRSYPSR
jgi:hypothetical protein